MNLNWMIHFQFKLMDTEIEQIIIFQWNQQNYLMVNNDNHHIKICCFFAPTQWLTYVYDDRTK